MQGERTQWPVNLGADSSAVCACLLPKVHGGTHTLSTLDLLCGVSKQHVAPIPAEGHLSALNDAAYLRRSGQENGTKHPDSRFCLPPVMAATRKLIWIEENRFGGWGCSECPWVFNPSGSPTGNSFDEMVQNVELQRDKAFTSHVCAEHPRRARTQKAGTI
jgi:hypothetical protein